MKTKKFLLIMIGIFSFLLLGGFSTAKLVDLYSTKKAVSLGQNLAGQIVNPSFPNSPSLSLGNLLYSNLHTQIKEEQQAGRATPTEYKNGWRKILAKNPKLAYAALNNYGPDVIKAFNQEFLKQTKKNQSDKLPTISVKTALKSYWQNQRQLLDKYQLLTQKLLNLPDSTLNNFVKEIAWEQEWFDFENERLATKTQSWLLRNSLIEKLPNHNYEYGLRLHEQIWYFGLYPLDLLLLTARISHDYPEWTPRKFLTEALKFSQAAKRIMPES